MLISATSSQPSGRPSLPRLISRKVISCYPSQPIRPFININAKRENIFRPFIVYSFSWLVSNPIDFSIFPRYVPVISDPWLKQTPFISLFLLSYSPFVKEATPAYSQIILSFDSTEVMPDFVCPLFGYECTSLPELTECLKSPDSSVQANQISDRTHDCSSQPRHLVNLDRVLVIWAADSCFAHINHRTFG